MAYVMKHNLVGERYICGLQSMAEERTKVCEVVVAWECRDRRVHLINHRLREQDGEEIDYLSRWHVSIYG